MLVMATMLSFKSVAGGGRRGLMVMALDFSAGGREFKPRRFQKHL